MNNLERIADILADALNAYESADTAAYFARPQPSDDAPAEIVWGCNDAVAGRFLLFGDQVLHEAYAVSRAVRRRAYRAVNVAVGPDCPVRSK